MNKQATRELAAYTLALRMLGNKLQNLVPLISKPNPDLTALAECEALCTAREYLILARDHAIERANNG
jgi:hypothetical protein